MDGKHSEFRRIRKKRRCPEKISTGTVYHKSNRTKTKCRTLERQSRDPWSQVQQRGQRTQSSPATKSDQIEREQHLFALHTNRSSHLETHFRTGKHASFTKLNKIKVTYFRYGACMCEKEIYFFHYFSRLCRTHVRNAILTV